MNTPPTLLPKPNPADQDHLNLLSGIFIRKRKHHVFSLIVAGFNCLHFPLGTALGVFTFVVLLRDSVQNMYRAAGAR